MKPDIKAAWIERLESGKEKQGIEALKVITYTPNGKVKKVRHCCLGVLCEMAKEAGVALDETQASPYGDGFQIQFNGYDAYLPPEVADWAGLARDEQGEVATVNDDSTTFRKSIKFIKENF